MAGAVLVFGATGGIGGAVAEGLAASGRPVHLAGRDSERLAALAARLGAPATVTDVLAPGAIARAVAEAVAPHGGRLAGLVFAVGSIVLKPLKRATVEDHLAAYRLNVAAAAEALAAAEAALKAGEGSVVLFSSVAARSGFANHAVIGPAKAAVEGLTVAAAAELAPSVRVNCIAPSLTRTGIAAPLVGNEAMAKAIAAQHPIPRLGEAEDSAALARFLLGPESGWITGQVFAVDGGRSSLRTKG
jgi:NAD(P)-dependent dehydrogenase (short-subunit alcohol dehydrogenase family)